MRFFRHLGATWPAAGLLAVAAVSGGPALRSPAAARSPARAPAVRQATYQGTTFTIPRRWPVINLAAHPRQCVRFDRHVLYLGTPGRNQRCPATLIGTTEAMLVRPSGARASRACGRLPGDRLITVVTTRRITVTATYGADRAQIARILASGSLRMPPEGSGGTPPPAAAGGLATSPLATPSTLPAIATSYTGQGFDACARPARRDADLAAALPVPGGRHLHRRRRPGLRPAQPDRRLGHPAAGHGLALHPHLRGAPGQLRPAPPGDQPGGRRGPGRGKAGPDARLRPGHCRSTTTWRLSRPRSARQVLRFPTSWTRELHALGYHSGFYSNSTVGHLRPGQKLFQCGRTRCRMSSTTHCGMASPIPPTRSCPPRTGRCTSAFTSTRAARTSLMAGIPSILTRITSTPAVGRGGGGSRGRRPSLRRRPGQRGRGRPSSPGRRRQAVACLVQPRARLARPGRHGRIAGVAARGGASRPRARRPCSPGERRPPLGSGTTRVRLVIAGPAERGQDGQPACRGGAGPAA